MLRLALIHEGEKVGSLALSFCDPSAFGASDRAFTLLLAQASASAMHRARTYNAERAKRREAEMLARAREDVLGVVVHDLRNPLNLVLMTAELMIDEELPLARRRELLGIAIRAAKEMNRLIEDLLDTVRLQAGRLSLAVEDVSDRHDHAPGRRNVSSARRAASHSLRDDSRGWCCGAC